MEKMFRVITVLGGSVLIGRIMYCYLDASVNVISVCRDVVQVVVVGRSIFKIYVIEEEQFVEKLNLRVGRKFSFNLSCVDVVWYQMDENLLVIAVINGVVVIWNLGRLFRNKQDQFFIEYKRTVNKVCFYFIEVYVLFSGFQDGFMKCFDFRRKDFVSIFFGEVFGGGLGRCVFLQAVGLSGQVEKCCVYQRFLDVFLEGFLEERLVMLVLEEWVGLVGEGRGRFG